MEQVSTPVLEKAAARRRFAVHGWFGILLVIVFWSVNWFGQGTRTAWAFFPLWLGYILTVDALNLWFHGTSLLTRGWRQFVGLFLVSAPGWWLFEVLNWRLRNWEYLGRDQFSDLSYFLFASLSFSTVMPAVFETAELISRTRFIRRMKPGLVIRPTLAITLLFFGLGWLFLGLLLANPRSFFPLVWMAVFFILEPINIWLGHPTIARFTKDGDWRPIVSLFLGAVLTGFFWEMWNYYAFPKWIYHVPGVSFLHVFEMPLLGYGGYMPFAMELYALYHLVTHLLGSRRTDVLQFGGEQSG